MVWLVSSTAMAGTLCDEKQGPSEPMSEAPDVVNDMVNKVELPCGGEMGQSYQSPRYNACFAASRLPVTTTPAWLATHMSDQMSMGNVFEQMRHLSSTDSSDVTLTALPGWMSAQLEEWQWQLGEQRRPSGVCLDNDTRESCGALPSPAVLVMAGSTSSAQSAEIELEIPWRPGTSRGTEEIPTRLAVGPSEGHPPTVDRPPEAS